jgi:hypothetical protein
MRHENCLFRHDKSTSFLAACGRCSSVGPQSRNTPERSANAAIPGGSVSLSRRKRSAGQGESCPFPHSEWYRDLRQSFKRSHIDIDSNDEQLARQLGEIKWKLTSKGIFTFG